MNLQIHIHIQTKEKFILVNVIHLYTTPGENNTKVNKHKLQEKH